MSDAALVGGVAGGVGGSLLLVITVLVVIVGVVIWQVRRRGHVKFNTPGKCIVGTIITKVLFWVSVCTHTVYIDTW